MDKVSKDPLDDPKVASLLSEVVASGKVETESVTLELVGRQRVGNAEYGTLLISKRNNEMQQKLERALTDLNSLLKKYDVHVDVIHAVTHLLNLFQQMRVREMETRREMAELPGRLVQANARSSAENAANARHSRPGGSREKAKEIREIWATGKYTSRDICAEEECAALGISFSAARKALRNTPEPTRDA